MLASNLRLIKMFGILLVSRSCGQKNIVLQVISELGEALPNLFERVVVSSESGFTTSNRSTVSALDSRWKCIGTIKVQSWRQLESCRQRNDCSP